mmetsp:Transcript_35307/g.67503  ORF Transcript_35307/g.67503 Transcript_35307/m.67503 type:complete len:177 (+) Transcript_35307:133-663(+)
MLVAKGLQANEAVKLKTCTGAAYAVAPSSARLRPTVRWSRKSQIILSCSQDDTRTAEIKGSPDHADTQGVKTAMVMLKWYKRQISPLLPGACRYVPTCSEYAMEAYQKYGVAKGTALTAWRLCRCNPIGGSGFDPPVWFGERKPMVEEILARPVKRSSGDRARTEASGTDETAHIE